MKVNLIHLLATSAVTIGLASCRTMAGYPWFFTMKFPDNVSLGELWLVEDSNCFTCGNGEKYLGPATGTKIVRLPGNGWFVSLRMPRNVQHLVPYLADTSLKHVGDINLQGSNVTDEDLKYVAGINLRSINLRETKIIGSGLK